MNLLLALVVALESLAGTVNRRKRNSFVSPWKWKKAKNIKPIDSTMPRPIRPDDFTVVLCVWRSVVTYLRLPKEISTNMPREKNWLCCEPTLECRMDWRGMLKSGNSITLTLVHRMWRNSTMMPKQEISVSRTLRHMIGLLMKEIAILHCSKRESFDRLHCWW